jgi:tRNA1Val (adenine37-N6)-methyltransferase
VNREYSQPDFYRFNSDSLALVEWIIQRGHSYSKVLDLGAGCGILGIELAQKSYVERITFVEIQKEYEDFLMQNIKNHLTPSHHTEVKWDSFKDVLLYEEYDLIVCNPPYYLPGHGQQSSNLQRMIARAFINDSWSDLFYIVERYLTLRGRAYFVIKNNPIIWAHILNEFNKVNLKYFSEVIGDVVMLEVFRLNKD